MIESVRIKAFHIVGYVNRRKVIFTFAVYLLHAFVAQSFAIHATEIAAIILVAGVDGFEEVFCHSKPKHHATTTVHKFSVRRTLTKEEN